MFSPFAAVRKLVQHMQVVPANDRAGLPVLIHHITLTCSTNLRCSAKRDDPPQLVVQCYRIAMNASSLINLLGVDSQPQSICQEEGQGFAVNGMLGCS